MDSKLDNALYTSALLIFKEGHPSPALLQRRLKLGYMRAMRIMAKLEELEIVGPQPGNKLRPILVKSEEEILKITLDNGGSVCKF